VASNHGYRLLRTGALSLGVASLVLSGLAPASAAGAKTKLVSQSGSGAIGNRLSQEPAVSSSGRFVVFQSSASNLVADDTNGVDDCFVRDVVSGSIERVSVNSSGGQSNGYCGGPAISADGRLVAFESTATNLANGDTNGTFDIFVHDRADGQTRRVSVSSNGEEANGQSRDPGLSADGKFVVFESTASNLVANDTNDSWDIFAHEMATGRTTRVSVRSNGAQADRSSRDPSTSGNGRYVVFKSHATNLVARDTNRTPDIFVHDRSTGVTKRVSRQSNGAQANGESTNPAVSKNGRYVAFDSVATNMVKGDTNGLSDVFVHDRTTSKTIRVSVRSNGGQANGGSADPTISATGRYVAFESAASNLVRNDTNGANDAFVYDRKNKTIRRVNLSATGKQAFRRDSTDPFISADGRFVVFESLAANLVSGDRNSAQDIFRRGPLR
jgi:hypothetical protein